MSSEALRPMVGERQPERPIDPGVRIGHVHLKVADLDRALGFYCSVLGFELMQRYGTQAAFIAGGGYPHHIGLNTWESLGGSPPPAGSTGLFHTATQGDAGTLRAARDRRAWIIHVITDMDNPMRKQRQRAGFCPCFGNMLMILMGPFRPR